jgi:hypothetical protein
VSVGPDVRGIARRVRAGERFGPGVVVFDEILQPVD